MNTEWHSNIKHFIDTEVKCLHKNLRIIMANMQMTFVVKFNRTNFSKIYSTKQLTDQIKNFTRFHLKIRMISQIARTETTPKENWNNQ